MNWNNCFSTIDWQLLVVRTYNLKLLFLKFYFLSSSLGDQTFND